ncbi:MAG TPA: hypothetical protein VLC49_07050 [Solirubrobacteraceae bacterium]|nr:hypothetical protein [Solirubrobacteraceae bacterium]
MAPVSYQTIALSKGKHASPEDGACVMELASMLAGEPFNDHPQSVCPVIGSLLRAYNDRIDDRRRQDLYAYAAKVIGSRGSQDVEDARAERLSAYARELHRSRWLQRLLPARLVALVQTPPADLVGSHAVCAIPQHDDKTHAEVLALIDELLTIGAGQRPAAGLLDRDQAKPGFRSPLKRRRPALCPPGVDEQHAGAAVHDNGVGLDEVALVDEYTLRDLSQHGAPSACDRASSSIATTLGAAAVGTATR